MRFASAIGSAGWSVAGSVSPPAIWGKLPSHADYVTHGVRADEVVELHDWLAAQVRPLAGPRKVPATPRPSADRWLALEPERHRPSPHSIPVAFVLPPDVLAFSGPQYVLGVVANSCDRLGRRHPLIVYQRANARWLRQHFVSIGDDAPSLFESDSGPSTMTGLRQPWMFWLARLVSRYARHPDAAAWINDADEIAPETQPPQAARAATAAAAPSLTDTVTALWALHAPGWSQYIGAAQRAPSAHSLQAVIDRAGSVMEHDAADDLRGVACSPWADWPDRIWSAQPAPAFWQQDSYGGHVGASQRLGELWGR